MGKILPSAALLMTEASSRMVGAGFAQTAFSEMSMNPVAGAGIPMNPVAGAGVPMNQMTGPGWAPVPMNAGQKQGNQVK